MACVRRAGCKIYVLDISEMAHVLGYPQSYLAPKFNLTPPMEQYTGMYPFHALPHYESLNAGALLRSLPLPYMPLGLQCEQVLHKLLVLSAERALHCTVLVLRTKPTPRCCLKGATEPWTSYHLRLPCVPS